LFLRGNNWITEFYHEGIRYRKSFGPISKTAAKEKERKFRTEVLEGEHNKKGRRVLFEIFAERYLTNARLNKKPSSVLRNEVSIKMLKIHFEGKLIGNIDSWAVEQYKKARKEKGAAFNEQGKEGKKNKGASGATINRDLATLRNMLNKAVEWKVLKSNPLKLVKLFRESNEKMWSLSPEEESRLLAACDLSPQHVKYLGDLVRFALNTGMRLGEIFNLKKADVDQEGQFLTVTESKTGKGRAVPMNGVVLQIIKKRMDFSGDYVFTNKRGGKLAVLTNAYWNAVKKAGLIRIEAKGETTREARFRFHDLRHTFGSRLGMGGADLKTIMEIMGHKTYTMAMRYQHPTPNHKLNAVKMLEKLPQKSQQEVINMTKRVVNLNG